MCGGGGGHKNLYVHKNLYEYNKNAYAKCLAYLNCVIDEVEKCINNSDIIGIWGTSIAAIWVSEIINEYPIATLQKRVFFIDEDEEVFQNKTQINGFPIYRAEEIMDNTAVLLPFPDYVAMSIKERFEKKNSSLKFIMFK